MDNQTQSILELPRILDWIAGSCVSSLGKDLIRRSEPLITLPQLRSEFDLLNEMMRAVSQGLTPPLTGLRDVRLLIRRAVIGSVLSVDDLRDLAETLLVTGAIYRWRSRLDERHVQLLEYSASIQDLGTVARVIQACIDSRGHVLDLASPELARIRQQLSELDERVKTAVNRLLRDPELRKILRFPNPTVVGDHYVLAIAANHRQWFPGVVHRSSGSGETLFVEPAAVAGLSIERVVLKGEEEREINRVLRRLTAEVAKVAGPLNHSIEKLSRLDSLQAKARVGLEYQWTVPHLEPGARLWLKGARHPLLEQMFRLEPTPEGAEPREVIPIEVRLGDGQGLLVITGPNTGGKTAALKTVGLIALMAQCGLPIPCEQGSVMPLFDEIVADIGDEQSLEQSLSTFSAHMARVSLILKLATSNSLVLIDELGAGTDPTEGAALGRSILDELDTRGCLTLVTTHLGNLKHYALHNPRALNAAVAFNSKTLRPEYRLILGEAGHSHALKIAARLDLPEGLLHRARIYLRRKNKRQNELRKLQAERLATEDKHRTSLAKEVEASIHQEEIRRRKAGEDHQDSKRRQLQSARETLRPGDHVIVASFGQKGLIKRLDLARGQATVHVGLGEWSLPLSDLYPTGFSPEA